MQNMCQGAKYITIVHLHSTEAVLTNKLLENTTTGGSSLKAQNFTTPGCSLTVACSTYNKYCEARLKKPQEYNYS